MANISSFYVGETKAFSYTITLNSSNPNITGDTVSFVLKRNKNDTDANALITKDADVATNGASGQADFELTPSDTDINPIEGFYEVKWTTAASKVYILDSDKVLVKERVYDV